MNSAVWSIYKFTLCSLTIKQDINTSKVSKKRKLSRCDSEFDVLLVSEDFVLEGNTPWSLPISAKHWGKITSAEKSPLMTKSIPTSRHGRKRLERHRLACKNSVTPVFNTLNSSFLYLVSILVVLLLWWLDQQVCKCEWANYLGGEVFDSSICFSFIHSALYTDCVWAPRVLQTRPLFQWLV